MNKEPENSDYKKDLVRYLAGEMSPEEQSDFKDLLRKDADLKLMYDQYSKIWNGADQIRKQDQFDMDDEWNQLQGKIDFNEGGGKVRSLQTMIVRIAAILVIGMIGIFGFYYIRNHASFERVEVAETIGTVNLKDGSEVTLNYDSQLKYSIDAENSTRKVILQGEAFFDVARDTVKPFIIDAGPAQIAVLGTSFNVDAYKERSTIEVTVYSGIVSMATQGKDGQELILRAGNKGVYHKKTQQLELIETSDQNDFAWKTRELYFSNTPLSEVVKVINEVYHTGIIIADDELNDCPITVTFFQQDLATVLRVLTNTLNIEMQREGGKIILTGEGC